MDRERDDLEQPAGHRRVAALDGRHRHQFDTLQRWYELDVTAYLQAEKAAGRNVVTLALKNLTNSTPYVQFVSRTVTPLGNRPQLVITR